MRKITGLLCAVAASAAMVAGGLSPAMAETPAPPAATSPAPGTTAPSTTVPSPAVPSPAATNAPAPVPTSPAAPAPATPGTPAPSIPVPSAPAPAPAPSTSAPSAPAPSTSASSVPGSAPAAMASSTPPKTADPEATPRPIATALAGAAAPGAKDPFVSKVLSLANTYRARNGAGPLVLSSSIGVGSQHWAVTLNKRINNNALDMATIHRTDAGASILPSGYDMYSEIIGINGTAEQVVDWWIASPSHRAALLDKRATDFGLGYVTTTKAGWGGMTVAVGNLAGYPASRKKQPQAAPTPALEAGDVAAVDSAGKLYVYPSAKGGDLWKRTLISSGWAGVKHLSVTDYNNDGRQDLLAVRADGRLTVSYGQTNGTLKAAKTIGTGWAPFDVVVSKWKSGSPYPSILAKHRNTGKLSLYPNLDGSRFGAPQQIGTGWGSLTILGADFDSDGRQDLLARNAAGQMLLYRGNGTGTFIDERRRVVGTGWKTMSHLSGIANHVGAGSSGVLARSTNGNLFYYPLLGNRWGDKLQLGTGGWSALKLGS